MRRTTSFLARITYYMIKMIMRDQNNIYFFEVLYF